MRGLNKLFQTCSVFSVSIPWREYPITVFHDLEGHSLDLHLELHLLLAQKGCTFDIAIFFLRIHTWPNRCDIWDSTLRYINNYWTHILATIGNKFQNDVSLKGFMHMYMFSVSFNLCIYTFFNHWIAIALSISPNLSPWRIEMGLVLVLRSDCPYTLFIINVPIILKDS